MNAGLDYRIPVVFLFIPPAVPHGVYQIPRPGITMDFLHGVRDFRTPVGPILIKPAEEILRSDRKPFGKLCAQDFTSFPEGRTHVPSVIGTK